MADFDVEVDELTGERAEWTDPATALLPTRLNSPRHPHRYIRINGPFPESRTFRAQVGGVDVVDAGLGGRLFSWGWSHYGDGPVPGFVTPVGMSYQSTVIFTASNTGLWLARCTRPESGAVIVGLNVELTLGYAP